MSLWEDIELYFKPSAQQPEKAEKEDDSRRIGGQISAWDGQSPPISDKTKIALFGVLEDRRAIDNDGCAKGPDAIRKQLFSLYREGLKDKIADLGNVERGESPEDTHYAVTRITGSLLRAGIIPVILGGSHDLTYASYAGFEDIESNVNLAIIDNRFDIAEFRDPVDARNFLGKIILHEPNFLFNYSHIGQQAYLSDPEFMELMDKLHFDNYRLGMIKGQLIEIEPSIRNADYLSIDMAALRAADSPGCGNAGPNGIYGEDICQMCFYAGMSDKLSCLGIYEYNPKFDLQERSAELVAEMIWCFLDGFLHRKNDFPFTDKSNYVKYTVSVTSADSEIIFYKSLLSDRWWMEVPYPSNKSNRFHRQVVVPCSYSDYQLASKDELPDKWWQTYQKLL